MDGLVVRLMTRMRREAGRIDRGAASEEEGQVTRARASMWTRATPAECRWAAEWVRTNWPGARRVGLARVECQPYCCGLGNHVIVEYTAD